MSATATRFLHAELPEDLRPWYTNLLMIDSKIVGPGVEVILMRSPVQDWCEKRSVYHFNFYVCVDVPGDDRLCFIGQGDDMTLEAAFAVYSACTDAWFKEAWSK